MLEEEKYCEEIRKKHFNKNIIMTKENKDDFKKAESCYICCKKYKITDAVADNFKKYKTKHTPNSSILYSQDLSNKQDSRIYGDILV